MTQSGLNLPFTNPAIPALLTDQNVINFKCFPGIACFNRCCKQADITLTPYDIVRLKHRFGISSEAFLKSYAVPFYMDTDRLPGLKLRTNENGECLLLDTEHGCTVYSDRPIVCRYYPLALLNIRHQDTVQAQTGYSLVKEEHCQGHAEARAINIEDYRVEQGCLEYDEYNRDWYRLILQKKSAGPGVGQPSEISLQMFFMASYNLDMFRRFVLSENFQRNYKLPDDLYTTLAQDDLILLDLSLKFLRQVLFGERSIEEIENAWERRLQERSKIWEIRTQSMQSKRQLETGIE